MKILLIGNYLNDNQESMQRFSAMLCNGLSDLGHNVRLLIPPAYFGRINKSGAGLGKWLGYLDKFIIFPFYLRKAATCAEIVHICDHSNSIYTRYLNDVPHLVTCHDLLAVRSALGEVKGNTIKWSGRIFQRMILNGLNHAKSIVCVSENTKNDVLRLTTSRLDDIRVVYNGLNYPYSPMEIEEAKTRLNNLAIPREKPFLLHVGGNQWYKNRIGVVKIFHEVLMHGKDGIRLIMVGKPWTQNIRDYVRENSLGDHIMGLSNVTNEDLRALYSTAIALLFPSLSEGFGWPIVEAQACGCPVLTTNAPPMTEVGGDAAIYFCPNDIQHAGQFVTNQLESLSNLKVAGLNNANRFNKLQMIQGYIAAYMHVLSSISNIREQLSE